LLLLRGYIAAGGHTAFWERIAVKCWSFFTDHPRLYRIAAWFLARLQQLLPGGKAFPVPGYIKERAIGRFDPYGFRSRYYRQAGNEAGQGEKHG
ncbi:MAG TPA: lactate utilization protein LutB domain-containing protein, partial [Spirochaetota bacterium]|nr:lactate utilization protein LutB domain-containing protein [Spirochaetota bacterium]